MTILEKIKNDRAWRGAAVKPAKLNGKPAWKITRDNAVAYVYQEAAQVQVRHWDQYVAAKAAIPIVRAVEKKGKSCKRHGKLIPVDLARVAEARVTLAHFKKLSGFDLMGEP